MLAQMANHLTGGKMGIPPHTTDKTNTEWSKHLNVKK